jgi:hypothetical protein
VPTAVFIRLSANIGKNFIEMKQQICRNRAKKWFCYSWVKYFLYLMSWPAPFRLIHFWAGYPKGQCKKIKV